MNIKPDKSPLSPGLKQRIIIFSSVLTAYVVFFLLLTPFLRISANYLVILPILAASFCFGLAGGIVSGFLGLPANLSLLYLRGYPDSAPASLLMAQCAGIVVGAGLGMAGSYFDKTAKEMARRIKREEELKAALEERELLYKELNHRVKNNLNIIKSLIQLQIYRSGNKEFEREGTKLVNRILSISLVHEQLYSGHVSNRLNLRDYLVKLTEQILACQSDCDIVLNAPSWSVPLPIPMEKAIPVGLIINEVVTNSIKYAFSPPLRDKPEITLTVENSGEGIRVSLFDNGIGFSPEEETEGLGTTLIKTLTAQLNGRYAFVPLVKGAGFTLDVPLVKTEADPIDPDGES